MTEDEKGKVWEALFRGKAATVSLYSRMVPLKDLKALIDATEAQFNEAMDIVMTEDD